jgi:multiple sugar transport system substrate-binding protein
LRGAVLTGAGAALAACAQPTPEVVKEVVKEEVEVTRVVEVEGETMIETVIEEREVEVVVTPTPGAAAEPVTVIFWAHDFQPRMQQDRAYLETFKEINPHITVEYENPGDWSNHLLTSLAAGVGPDLFAEWNAYIGVYYYQGTIVPVDYVSIGMDEAEFMSYYIEPQNTLQGATFEGELYGIPNELSIYCFHTNNALWEEAGLDPVADMPKTWEDLVPIAEQMTKRDSSGNLIQRGFEFGWDGAVWMFLQWGAMLRQAGGSELSDDLRSCTIDSPEAAKALQYWKDWVEEGRGGPQYPNDQESMLPGTIAAWAHTGSWARPSLLENEIEYTVHPVPRWADGPNNNGFDIYAYFHMVNVEADAEVKPAAWQVAWYLDSHPVRYLETTGLLQPKKVVEESAVFQDTPFLDVFLDEMTVSMYSPRVPGFLEIADALARTRDRACVEGMAVEESLAIGKEEIDAILDESWAAVGA